MVPSTRKLNLFIRARSAIDDNGSCQYKFYFETYVIINLICKVFHFANLNQQ
jgi:hypothetical protein